MSDDNKKHEDAIEELTKQGYSERVREIIRLSVQ